MKTAAFYQEDLAVFHNTHYSQLSEAAAALLLQKLREMDILSGTVIDLGCGSGTLAKVMADAGYDTIGVDCSEPMLEIARVQSPETSFLHASIWDYQPPRCVAITAVGEVINYASDGKNTDTNIERLFQKCFHCLKPGGIFLFDFIAPGILNGKTTDKRVMRREGWTTIVDYHENKAEHKLSRDITLFREITPEIYRKSREIHRARLFESTFLQNILHATGFKTEALEAYGTVGFRYGHFGILSFSSFKK